MNLGLVVAGGASGWSKGRLAEIKAEREARMEELREQRADRRAKEDRDFRSKEAAIGREFEGGENEKSRKQQKEMAEREFGFRRTERVGAQEYETGAREDTQEFGAGESAKQREFAGGEAEKSRKFESEEKATERTFTQKENEKTRAYGADVVTGEDGNSYVRVGDAVTPLTDLEGKPIKLLAATKDAPADQQMMEYLVTTGVAKDRQEAFRMVRQSRTDREGVKAVIFKAAISALTEAGVGEDELQQRAEEFTRKSMLFIDEEEGGTDGSDVGMAPGSGKPPKDGGAKLMAPAGDGTADNPFAATQQSHVDWFKKYAKPGQVIVVDGKRYKK